MRKSSISRHRVSISVLSLVSITVYSGSSNANEALAKKSSCTACHAMSTKVMGPSFRDIAEKYAGKPDAVDALSQSIRQGGAGRWGSLPMPPQAQLSPTSVTVLASWLATGAK